MPAAQVGERLLHSLCPSMQPESDVKQADAPATEPGNGRNVWRVPSFVQTAGNRFDDEPIVLSNFSSIRSLDFGPAHVVGLSLGGFIACQLAVDHGDLVRTLIAVNSVPDLTQDTLRDRFRITSTIMLRKLIVRFFWMRALGRFLCKKLFPRDDQEELR